MNTSYDPMEDLIHANIEDLLRKHQEAIARIRKETQRQDKKRAVECIVKILDALNTFHPMHGESWQGWPEHESW